MLRELQTIQKEINWLNQELLVWQKQLNAPTIRCAAESPTPMPASPPKPMLKRAASKIAVTPPKRTRKSCAPQPRLASFPRSNPRYRFALPAEKRAFLRYIVPIATRVQADTGFPASVLIAQAALESGWGKSAGARERHSLFGQACFGTGKIDYPVRIGGRLVHIRGYCRPGRGLRPDQRLVFERPEDSVYAYVYNLLQNRKTAGAYAGVRAAVRRVNPGVSLGLAPRSGYRPMSYSQVIWHLSEYSQNRRYQSDLLTVIRANGLGRYDHVNYCSTLQGIRP